MSVMLKVRNPEWEKEAVGLFSRNHILFQTFKNPLVTCMAQGIKLRRKTNLNEMIDPRKHFSSCVYLGAV